MKKGWTGASNVFAYVLDRSIVLAVMIISYHLSRLFAHKGEGASQLAMYNDFEPSATSFLQFVGTKKGDITAQKELTKEFESEFKDMASKLDEFDSLTRDVHPVNSSKYNLIWGTNRYKYYQGSYDDRIASLFGLANEMTNQTVPLGAAAVLEYRTEIMDKHTAQRNRMVTVGNDKFSLSDLRYILSKKLNKNRGGLLFRYGDLDNCEELVKSYFPINLLGDHGMSGHYQMIVSKGDFDRVCIHLAKKGEKYYILAKGADLWISSADNSDNPVASGFLAKDGIPYTIEPEEIGDITKKFIMATNLNLTSSADLIFNIVKSKE